MRHRMERACGSRRPDQRELLAHDQIRIDMRKQLSMLHFILLMLGDSEWFRYRIGRKEDTYEALARNKQKGARKELTFGTIQRVRGKRLAGASLPLTSTLAQRNSSDRPVSNS